MNKFGQVYEKIKYELPVFSLLFIQMIPQDLDFSSDPYASLLALDYSIGFVPRVFTGAVMSLFSDYRGREQINVFFSVVFVLSFLLVSWIAGRLIRSADDDTKKMTIFFIALFLAGPYSNSVLFPQMFSTDRMLVLYTMLALLVINKPKVKWALPFILFAALATHNMFTFSYMPVIAVLLLYEWYKNGYSKQNLLFCVVNGITIISFSVYFYLFSGLKNTTLEALIAYAKTKTDVPVREDMYLGYFFVNPSVLFTNIHAFTNVKDIIRAEGQAVLFLLPLIVLFFYIWKSAYKLSAGKFEKFIYTLCLLVPLARLPLLPVNSEVYRGRVAVIFVQFCLIFYFLYNKNSVVTESVKKIGGFFKNNTLLMLFIIAFYSSMFFQYAFTPQWKDMFEKLTTFV